MKKLIFLSFIVSTGVQAQGLFHDIQKVNEKIGEKAIDEGRGGGAVSGEFFGSLAMPVAEDPADCDKDKKKEDDTRYELILVANSSSFKENTKAISADKNNLYLTDLKFLVDKVPESAVSMGLSESAIIQRASDIWESGWINVPSEKYDPKSPLGRDLLIEGLIQAAGRSSLPEKDLAKNIAVIAGNIYKSDEERFTFLSDLSRRLYRNYNVSRNPGFDNPKNNPSDVTLPAGDITLNEMLSAAANFNTFGGGVCNDISESVIMVGEHLFPKSDVLAVNSGSHFGVVVADGKKNRIIDGGVQYEANNNLLLDPSMSPTNLRISKVENGKLREIAVVDTEIGQLTEAAFQTGKKLLKVSPDINSVIGHFKKKNLEVGFGEGVFNDSHVTIVVAKYHTKHDKWNAYLGVGATSQDYYSDSYTKYQAHLRAGVERNIFHYINPKTEVRFDSGVRTLGMYTLNPRPSEDTVPRVDMSGALEVVNSLTASYGKHNPNGIQLLGRIEVEHSAGPKNWGNTTGAISYMNPADVGTVLKNSRFHLNQVNADLTAEKKISGNMTAISNVHYQGSNIGQSVSALAGLNITVPQGAELLVFVSHSDSLFKGYETKHSLLASPQGTSLGAMYRTRSGIEVGTAVRNISGETSIEGRMKIPLGKKK